ncbi:MAG: hypothetical protein IPI65_16485 [Bacteroidetes bacterium]|nr:hypothetical protein [Bacteroidota bacterium]
MVKVFTLSIGTMMVLRVEVLQSTALLEVTTITGPLTVEVVGGDGGNVDNTVDGVNCTDPVAVAPVVFYG